MEAPFALNSVEEVAGYDLMKCGLYRTLPPEGKEIVKKNKYVLQYLHMIPLERIGTPKFYKELSRKLKEMKDPNVIYPVSDEIAVHICPDKNDARNYYIPIEPHLFQDLSDLIAEVEKRIALLVDKYEEPRSKEEQRKILEKCIDEVCEVVHLNGGEYVGRRGMLLRAASLRLREPNNGSKFSRIFNALRSLFLDGNGKIPVTPFELRAIKYLMVRDKVGLGVLEPFIHDPYIEDISCSGLGNIFIEHKIFESLKAPIVFEREEELDDFVLKLSEKIGKPVSFRNPIVDATLPDGSRINIVYGRDISKKGSNFTIRKFSKKPLSVLQLIEFGTFNYLMAAYFWIALREGMNCFVVGETASGKTTTLNAITTFVPPNAKIISIEDTPEVQIPHKNWLREVTRSAGERKGSETSSVEMFDLLKAALRQRPNLIIVGEIRGIEGNIAFQAMQTGHAVMSTFHAASVEKLIQRLTGDPIRVPKTYIDNLNFVIIQNAVRLKGKLVRRVTSVSEIIGYDPPSDTFSYIEVFRWNPATDTFEFTGNLNSYMLEEKIAVKRGIPHNKKRKIYKELEKRANILKKIHESGVTDFYELFNLIAKIEKEGVI
ncbi:MAG: Type IV secretory pathway ATPase VirB11/Archaellum biosynthesis ATPase ArlI/FlaI [Candidatus Alkanophagales archaeon MCA70_species_1]|nr:Type IV secretory pathway ATPase VirB11/Archaellum biosynthesis ATPase ArlI/FlaI [Candidatus Alkanophaga volatiphilum]